MMKTFTLVNSYDEIFTFLADLDKKQYMLKDSEGDVVMSATDTEDGLEFDHLFGYSDEFEDGKTTFAYYQAEYMRIFLHMLSIIDPKLFDGYMITQPIGIL